jgi:hypothetical protein
MVMKSKRTTTMWLDVESGNYYSSPPLRVYTKDWSTEDWYAWMVMNDSERRAWGEYHLKNGLADISPSVFCRDFCSS